MPGPACLCALRHVAARWFPRLRRPLCAHVSASVAPSHRCLASCVASPFRAGPSLTLRSHLWGSGLRDLPRSPSWACAPLGPLGLVGPPLSRPPPSRLLPLSGLPRARPGGWGRRRGAGRPGGAGRGGDAGPAGLEARRRGAGAQSRVRPAEPRAPRPRPAPPPGRPAGEGA